MSRQTREAWTQVIQKMQIQRPKSKYNAQRVTVDGIVFHSKREAQRYHELKLMEKAKEITNLALQPRFVLSVPLEEEAADETDPPTIIGAYVADFSYFKVGFGLVVEDVKGFKTPLYRWKKKHVEAQYGITIREI